MNDGIDKRHDIKGFLETEIHAAARHQICKRKSVICLAIPINADGEEGVPLVFQNGPINDDPEMCSGEIGNCGCVHAEFQAVRWCIRMSSILRWHLAVNYSPCTSCANLIVVSQCVRRVYYATVTEHDKRGLRHLQATGIETIQI